MRERTLIVLLAALLAAPLASAGWAGKGMHEPDTARDLADGYMQQAPDWSVAGSKVYFNAFSTHSAGFHAEVATSVNPNSGAAESRYLTSAGRMFAMLGVWKDCNKDGFVGWGDQGLWEYRSELLTVPNANGVTPGTSVCPVTALPATIPAHTFKAPHNDGQWVHEFIPIGYEISNPSINVDPNPFNIMDMGARVWVDWNLPESPANTRCYGFQPQGTFHSTGGLLEYGDCFTGFKITDTWNGVAPDGTPAGQLSFNDEPRDQSESRSLLNVANPWGEPGADSYADAFDCTDPLVPSTRIGSTTNYVMVPRPSVPSANPSGSVGGTLNETESDFQDCDRSNSATLNAGNLPYSPETPISNTNDKKHNTDFTLAFSEGCRRNAVPQVPNCNIAQLGQGAPGDLGTRAADVEGFWSSTTIIGEDRTALYDRETQLPRGVSYVTAYARLSPAAIQAYGLDVPGVPGTYGAAHCNGPVEITGEWECDATKWWPVDDGTPNDTIIRAYGGGSGDISARVGEPFTLRDIDCYDFSVKPLRDEGISWGSLTSPVNGGSACA